MRWTARIALRYLFAKRGEGVVQVVTAVSTAGIVVVTAAMICVLSVMNGFSKVVGDLFSQFDPPLKVVPAEGKWIQHADSIYALLANTEGVESVSREIKETALIQYKDHRMPATLIGVDSTFRTITHIDSIITDGYYSTYDGAFERAVLGRGLSAELGMNAHFVGGIHLYAPKRIGAVNRLRPETSLNEGVVFIAGTFAVNQAEYDDQLMIVSLPMAQHLFDADSTQVTAFNLSLTKDAKPRTVQKRLEHQLGQSLCVLNQQQQQADFYRIFAIEKALTMLLLFFILLIAACNTIGSLTMLIIDKQKDIHTFHHLGASMTDIRTIFLLEGWMVGMLGAVIGIVLGLTICLIQEHFGLITIGNGTEYILSAYPVEVQALDILYVLFAVIVLTAFTAWIPSRKISG